MQPGGNPIFFFVFMLVIAYFMLIRPEQKRRKEHQEMIKNLKKNDEVVTASGVHATIVAVKDSTFIIRVDENTKMEIDKPNIAYVKKVR
jgi:preprotein translocase subunit YajC